MAILDYSAGLSRGGLGSLSRQIGVAQGLQGLQQNRYLMEQAQQQDALAAQQAERQAALQQEAAQAFQSQDPNRIAQVFLQSPELGQQVLQARGIVDEAGRKRVSDRFASVYTSPNPKQTLQQSIIEGEAAGLDMSDSKAILAQNLPDDEVRRLAGASLAAVDPERQQGIQAALESGRSEPLTAYEQVKAKQKEVDQQLRARELELKALQAQQKSETNELQKQRLEQDIEAKKQSIETAKAEKVKDISAAANNSQQLISNIDQILNNEDYIDTLTGVTGVIPTVMPSSRDADVVFDQLVNSLTLDNLGLMSGVLTDRDIQVLRSAAAGIEKGMTKDKFVSQLRSIKNRVASKLKTAQKSIKDDSEYISVGDSLPDTSRTPEEILRQYGIE